MNVRWVLLCFGLLATQQAGAQGFADLGTASPEFAAPDPDYSFEFPRDDGQHPEFRIEWWYLTANLTGANGTPFGIQWSLFRQGLTKDADQGWQNGQVWMAHAAVTSPNQHRFEERFARGGAGQAGVQASPFEAWLDDWVLSSSPDEQTLKVDGDGFAYDLKIASFGPPVLHGEDGYSVKSGDGTASHYYSRPFLRASGSLTLDGQTYEVSGDAWIDREWSSQLLAGDQDGWDWLGLSLDDGSKVMVARVRGAEPFYIGTLIAADGRTTTLDADAIQMVPVGTDLPPTAWTLLIPQKDIDLNIKALNERSWTGRVFQYWEGPVVVTGSNTGRGYLEMTGYP